MVKLKNEIIRNCVFGIKCEKDWNLMEHVRDDKNDNEVRFCSGCEKEVFATVTPTELYQNVTLNRCVAIILEDNLTTVGYIVPEDLELED